MPRPRDHGFAAHAARAKRQRNALERMAFEAVAKDVRPGDGEPAIGGPERRYRHALRGQHFHPRPVGSEPRPACAAERQHGRARIDGALSVGRLKQQRPSSSQPVQRWRSVNCTPMAIEPPQPRAQQRRGLERFRETPGRWSRRRSAAPAPRSMRAKRPAETPRSRPRAAASPRRSGRGTAGSASLWVRLSPPRPAIRNLRPADGIAS